MKMTQRLIALVSAILIGAAALTSCSAPDVDTPDGMQLASLDGVEYALYVPESWTVNKNSGVSGAYVSAYDKSNVSLVSYVPTAAITMEQYWTMCEESYKAEFENYALLENGTTTMAGATAPYYVYSATVSGVEYKFLQAIVANNGMFYLFTYTAEPANYDTHIESVMEMIEVFTFR